MSPAGVCGEIYLWGDGLADVLKGNPVRFVDRTGNQGIEQPFAIDPRTMQRYEWKNGNNPNIPDNSVSIIPISGPILKYNGNCGEPGVISRNCWLIQMQNRAHIGSVVMIMDTPGGEARAAGTLAPTITNFGKPILVYLINSDAQVYGYVLLLLHLLRQLCIAFAVMLATLLSFFRQQRVLRH